MFLLFPNKHSLLFKNKNPIINLYVNLLSFNHQKKEYVVYTTYSRKCKKMDRRTKKTIQSIDNAFISLMKKKSFDKITINEVSEIADINRVTFYNYFFDKYDWFQKYLYKLLDAFINLEKNLDFNCSNEEIYHLFYQAYSQTNENFEQIYLLLVDKTTPFHHDLENISKQSFQDKLKLKKEYTDIELSFEIQYYISISIGLLEWWIKEKRPWSVEEISRKSAECLKNWII